jgi:hypothetical protein
MNQLPDKWQLIEQWDSNFIYENEDKTFCVNVDFTNNFYKPYSIGFNQLKGNFVVIGYDYGAYSINAFIEIEAIEKHLT